MSKICSVGLMMALEAFNPAYKADAARDDHGLKAFNVRLQVSNASIADIVYHFNVAPSDMSGQRQFDAASIVVRAESKDDDVPLFFDRFYIEAVFKPLIERNVFLFLVRLG